MTEELASMKAQVYKDPRPEGVLRPLPRAVAHARARLGLRGRPRSLTSLYAWTFFRARGIAAPRTCRHGPGDHRPEPLLVHGPLLRRRVHPAARALHGEVAAVRAADAVDLHATAACSRCAAATATRRRSSPRTRSSSAAARSSCTARAAARARASCPTSRKPRHRPARAGVGRARRARRDARLLAGAQLEAPAVPEGHRRSTASRALGSRRGSDPRPAEGRGQGGLRPIKTLYDR